MYLKLNRITLYAALVVAISACATTPVDTKDAANIPIARVLNQSFLKRTEHSGEVIIKRDSGMTGAGCTTRLYVDGAALADLDTSEKIVIYLQPGDHLLGAQPNGICSGGLTETRATVTRETRATFRFGTSGNGNPSIYPTAF